MKVNTIFLLITSFCYYFASAVRIDPSELKDLSVASPGTIRVQNLQKSKNDVHKDSMMFEKRADVQPSGEARLAIKINDFFENLKSYTVRDMFRFAPFDNDASKLDRELTKLVRHVEALPAPGPVLLNRLQFVQIVFQDMKYASEVFKTFPRVLNTNESILRNLIQLNAILFQYRDSDGLPDPSVHEYGVWVHSLSIVSEEWVSDFGVANESPIALRLLFNRQLLRLRADLDALKSAILDEA
ncbi:hypothetical protein OXX80_008951 [Metschnikowia pulcherrima]